MKHAFRLLAPAVILFALCASAARAETYMRIGAESLIMNAQTGPYIALGTCLTPDADPYEGRYVAEIDYASHDLNNGKGKYGSMALTALYVVQRDPSEVIHSHYYAGVGLTYARQYITKGGGGSKNMPGLVLRLGTPLTKSLNVDLDYIVMGRVDAWKNQRAGGFRLGLRFNLPKPALSPSK